jgi:predicted membrane-bound spermidine synthase
MTPTLCAVFFASGASALILETLWFRQAGLVFGNSMWATSLVLSAFMSGLAVGNGLGARRGARLNRALWVYAAAELAIAVTGVGLVYLLPALGDLLGPALGPLLDSWLLNPVRLLLAFVLLLVPSTAIGVTLPLLTNIVTEYDRSFGSALGTLYGWNTLGAVVGVVVGELYLIRALGIRGTALAAGSLNVVAAGIAMVLPSHPIATTSRRSEPMPAWSARWLAAAFLSGFCLLALEVLWFRLLLLVVMAHAEAFALMLAVVLIGIAAGGLLAAGWVRRSPDAHRWSAAVAFATGVLCVLSYAAFPRVIRPYALHLATHPQEIVQAAAPLILPVAMLSGIFFTLAGAGLRPGLRSDAQAAGALTLANTAGAALGSLAGGFALVPWLGIERSIALVAGLYGVLGLWLAFARVPQRGLSVAAAAWVLVLIVFPFGTMSRRLLPLPVSRYLAARSVTPTHPTTSRLVATHEGLNETIQYLELSSLGHPIFHQMLTNAIAMADTEYFSRRYMKLYVYWPMAVHPHLRRALLICYGVGNTAKAMVDENTLETIDVVDISRDVLDMSSVPVPKRTEDPLQDPRVRVHVEDGRYFLQSTAQSFDLITAEPPPPTAAGTVNLYTREYFSLLRKRLTRGGMVAYWLPLHILSTVATKAVLRAFCDVFDDCSLWNGSGAQLMMVGTRDATGRASEEHFSQQWRNLPVATEMKRLGYERPEQLGAAFIGDAAYVRGLIGTTPPLTDDEPKRIDASVDSLEEADRMTRSLIDVSAARTRFAASPLIRRLWPERLIGASLPYFDVQRVINLYTRGEAPRAEMAYDILTRTTLTTPVLWLLGSDWDLQRIVTSASPAELGQPRLQFQLGIRLIAERSYAAAVGPLSRSERAPELRAPAFAYRVFALCMSAQIAEAQKAVTGRRAELRGEFWDWMRQAFGLDTRADGNAP